MIYLSCQYVNSCANINAKFVILSLYGIHFDNLKPNKKFIDIDKLEDYFCS